MLPERMLEIIEASRFRTELQQIVQHAKRADEFINGAKWVLCRNPEAGKRIGTSHVWFFAMEEIPGILPVVLYYTFDEDSVIFLSIQETTYPPQ